MGRLEDNACHTRITAHSQIHHAETAAHASFIELIDLLLYELLVCVRKLEQDSPLSLILCTERPVSMILKTAATTNGGRHREMGGKVTY